MVSASCIDGLLPCSATVTGNIVLIIFYGSILGSAAKVISDGSELLLDILNPGLIGGLLLPVLGALPDCAVVIASGAGAADEVQEELAIGVGTLAGSTIMLLTLPWALGMFLARLDIRRTPEGKMEAMEGFRGAFSWKNQGVTVDDDMPINSIIMMITSLSYLIIQGVAFAYLAHPESKTARSHERGFALATCIVCLIAFVLYGTYQVLNTSFQERKIKEAHRIQREHILHNKEGDALVLLFMHEQWRLGLSDFSPHDAADSRVRQVLAQLGSFRPPTEASPLIDEEQQRDVTAHNVGLKWKKKAKDSAEKRELEEDQARQVLNIQEDAEEPRTPRQIATKAAILLVIGTGFVAVFADPMVSAINNMGEAMGVPPFYISFIVTPFASNASEVISSLIFAMKMKKTNSSLTYSQLYGAATMNNTLVLGIFVALVYMRNLVWEFSAEVIVILLVEVIVGIFALRTTMKMWMCIPVLALYPLSLLFVWFLENVVGWQ